LKEKNSEAKNYDYIIAGAGLAGLSLAIQLLKLKVPFKKILIVDQDHKTKNDRTWCFWTKQKNVWYKDLIYKQWQHFSFSSSHFVKEYNLEPYTYCMIRGIDFYKYCFEEIKKDGRFEIKFEQILELKSEKNNAVVITNHAIYSSKYVFNSAFRNADIKPLHHNYVQHFKGVLVETTEPSFNKDCPVFMDFDIAQDNDCRFVYIIPHSETQALIEYTGFSKTAIAAEAYDEKIKSYLEKKLKLKNYNILESEKGEIPMYESAFVNPYGKNVINIGTAGGSSKPSTGYTFYFVQMHIQNIVWQLKTDATEIKMPKRKKRFLLYDKILLDVINSKKIPASDIFSVLFERNAIVDLLAFLNEESTLIQDLKIMNSVPKKHFLKSAIKKTLQ
jgi:lycopene beta-cyclase